MIVTVTLNPALDLTYAVDALIPHGTHRVAGVSERAGGKGLNVARVLHTLGEPVLATGLLGGATGTRVEALLTAEGVPVSFVRIRGETRRTVAVVDPGDATGFWEPGPTVAPGEWTSFVDHFRSLLDGASVVALSGSLPPGVPLDAYAVLIDLATEAGVPTVLDSSGEALRQGLRADPTVAKPNAAELRELLADADGLGAVTAAEAARHSGPSRGEVADRGSTAVSATPAVTVTSAAPETSGAAGAVASSATVTAPAALAEQRVSDNSATDVHLRGPAALVAPAGLAATGAFAAPTTSSSPVASAALAAALRALTSGTVVVSRGPEGLLAFTADGVLACTPPAAVDGNPTGAGDACVAALARGLRDGIGWADLLADAVALSAAAVAAPVAGAFDPDVYQRMLTRSDTC